MTTEPTSPLPSTSRSALLTASQDEVRAVSAGAAVLVLTTIHHVYGALHYDTPERYHAVLMAAPALGLILGGYALGAVGDGPWARVGRLVSCTINGIFAALLFGGVEGFYNHVLKVALYFGGLSEANMRWLYRDPLFELPNDWFFEVTGVLQAVPGFLTAYYLTRLFTVRRQAAPAPDQGPTTSCS